MIRIGITGQAGFIGNHLWNTLGTVEGVERIPFEDAYFDDAAKLREFVRGCDAIVHLAAVNRDPDSQHLYDTNIRLTQSLIDTMEAEQVAPHVVLSSSIQETRGNLYGDSKRECRRRLADWAARHGAKFSGCVLPNVFGPFGHPNYNSFVATFCHRLTHDETPEIMSDAEVPLIHVSDVCAKIIELIRGGDSAAEIAVAPGAVRKVSEVLKLLEGYRDQYLVKGMMPSLTSRFDAQLFATFLTYIDHAQFFPFVLTPHADERGRFVEVAKLDGTGGQVSFSTTRPGVTRGNHYHTRKVERFAVISGKARIDLRRIGTDKVLSFEIDGDQSPAFVDMPVWYTHSITNVGDRDLFTIFWINEWYDPADGDTFFEKVRA